MKEEEDLVAAVMTADQAGRRVADGPTVFAVQPLLRELILEAVGIEGLADYGYAGRITTLILDQFWRARLLPGGATLAAQRSPSWSLRGALCGQPADPRWPEEWNREIGMSSRTLARRFAADIDMGLRSQRRRVRLFKAIELMGRGLSVTQTAMQLGYGLTSAFVYALRNALGCGPQAYMREQVATRPSR